MSFPALFPQFLAEWKAKTEQKLSEKEKEKVIIRVPMTKTCPAFTRWKRSNIENATNLCNPIYFFVLQRQEEIADSHYKKTLR